jgi:hypothetical protein
MHVDVREADRDMAKVELDKAQVAERAGQRRREDGLDRVFDDLGAGDADVGPQLLDNVVEEAWSCELRPPCGICSLMQSYLRARRRQRQ